MSDPILRALRTVPDFPEPGIQFKDISPILADAGLLAITLEALIAPWRDRNVKTVLGIESRGFLFGAMMAERLGTGFAMVRKPGKLPARTVREDYELEYGTDAVEVHADAIEEGDRVLVHDDVLATGGTSAATARLVERLGGEVVGFSFLIEIAALKGRARLADGIRISSAVVV